MKPITGLFTLFCLLSLPVKGLTAERPNILYLYVDDMGWGSIGPNGQAARRAKGLPAVLTPNLDQLAASGINFTRAYGATVCSPARSSQQTGFHQGHTFADRNDPDNAKKAIRADDLTMGDVLSSAGYVTGYWGKWGYGGTKALKDPELVNLETLPTSHGYSHVLAELHHVRAHTFFQPTLWKAPANKLALGGMLRSLNTLNDHRNNPAYPDGASNHNHPDYPKTAYCDDSYAFATLDFIRAQAKEYKKSGRPFFALFAAQIPHGPFGDIAQLPEWDRAYKKEPYFAGLKPQSKQWAAMVTRIDAHIGQILAALEDPDGDGDRTDSVSRNTLVVFQSDNGGPSGNSNQEFNGNGGLRGSKGSIHEGGIRVPTIMRWPEKIHASSSLKAGTHSDKVIDVSDLLPTFAELAGGPAPVGIDGVSLAPLLTGEGRSRDREFLIHEAGDGASIIRGRHKLILRSAAQKKITKKRKTSTVRRGIELYDLEKDRAEKTNIAAAHPALVQELEAILVAERVMEPAGFANSYHRWTGADDASTADADNWSDYVYANAGITHMTDTGAPRPSWTAVIENTGAKMSRAKVEKKMDVLGLEIRGKTAVQQLTVEAGQELHARNELRIANKGVLSVQSGRVSSQRWLDVLDGGSLQGTGHVDADLYLGAAATLLSELPEKGVAWEVAGEVHLNGTLEIMSPPGSIQKGQEFVLIKATRVQRTFSNPDNSVKDNKGHTYRIHYHDTSVSLFAE